MKKFLAFLMVVFLGSHVIWAGESFSWDFSDCEIKDIIFAVSVDTGISIVPDDTVFGKSDFKFYGEDFEVAFDSFLLRSRLYVIKQENLWVVSKIKIVEQNGLFSLDACDLTPLEIIEKVSIHLGDVIRFDSLPGNRISVHLKELSKSELYEALGNRFGNYKVLNNDDGLNFVKRNDGKKVDYANCFVKIWMDEIGQCNVDVKDVLFSDVIEELFNSEISKKTESFYFCLVGNTDVKIQRSVFRGKDFFDVLDTVCGQNGFCYEQKSDVIYIYQQTSAKENFIFGEKKWVRFDLKYTDIQKIISMVEKNLGKIDYSSLEDGSGFFAKVSTVQKEEILKLIDQLDVKQSTYTINLKYIKPAELLEHLPPFIDKANLYIANDNSNIYFKGTEASYKNLMEQIEVCDKPESLLTYDLLILQYEESEQKNWGTNFSTDMLTMGDRNSITAQLGSVLNLNLNVVSAFGLEFAANLQSSLEENKSNIFVDTTLHGVSGKAISFQNTNTFRYRDNNLDPDTGKPIYSGVTKEIVSGIKLNITGWVSGEGVITSVITASVSRQGSDTSSSTGNPPPTTEKIVTTEVCGKSGIPIVISGLTEKSENSGVKGIPFLMRIPLIGRLFKTVDKTSEKSQMVIYLVPRIENHIEEKIEKSNSSQYRKLIGMLEEKKDK